MIVRGVPSIPVDAPPAFKGCCPLTGLMIGTVVVDAATILTAPAGGKDDDDDDMVRCLDYSVQHCL